MTLMTDNRDLAIERQRLGLSQQDVADLLCGFDPSDPAQRGRGFNFSAVSRFETGDKQQMPAPHRGEPRIGRAEYEALIQRLKSERGAA